MFKKLLLWLLSFHEVNPPATQEIEDPQDPDFRINKENLVQWAEKRNFQKTINDYTVLGPEGMAMDSNSDSNSMISNKILMRNQILPFPLLNWFGAQGFIGYQQCALLAQNWLIDKACTLPARDAIRKGYTINVTDGTKIEATVLEKIKKYDTKYQINKNLVEFVRNGKIFGIRIAMFKLEGAMYDEKYYEKPFNLDSITPNSYLGITQIDPYWVTPELGMEAASDPSAIDFYEPTWWRVNGMRIHRTHLVIMRTTEPADVLKPTYIYGGIPLTQQIYLRVYAAERTADEAPQLTITKRLNILKCDMSQALAKQDKFMERLEFFSLVQNNYGTKTIDKNDEMQQFDTSLADLDAVIMTQYQLVAAVARIPAVKLMGTTPKGFNATGEFEEANYHEELESIQAHDMAPLLDRHHALLIRSKIVPDFNIPPFETSVAFNPLDSLTDKEQAEINKIKAEAGLILIQSGAINANEERQRIIKNPSNGYDGLEEVNLDNELFEGPDALGGDPESV